MKIVTMIVLISVSILTKNAASAQPVPTYTVTFDLGDEGTLISGELFQTVSEGGTAIAPEISVNPGSTFIGWDKSYHNVNDNLNLRAQYINQTLAGIAESNVITIDNLTYEFGYSLSVSGDVAVIGATGDDEKGAASGSMHAFVRIGDSWFLQKKLVASDGAAGDYLGKSVSLNGDTAVVGAPRDDDNGADSGSAYVFVRRGSDWIEQAKLTAGSGSTSEFFGCDVGISSDTAVIGAWGSGSAYVFMRVGDFWVEQAKLTAGDGIANSEFGSSVSISGDTIVIGASADNGLSGSAHVFVRNRNNWLKQAKLVADDGSAGDQFGDSVSISGDTILIGAPGDDANSGEAYAGSAYVFVRNGNRWIQQTKLTASDGKGGSLYYNRADKNFVGGDRFGHKVSLSGDIALIGAWGSGSAYVFKRNEDRWNEESKLACDESTRSNYFSSGLDVSGDVALVIDHRKNYAGNRTGRAHFYDLGAPVAMLQEDKGNFPVISKQTAKAPVPEKKDYNSATAATIVGDSSGQRSPLPSVSNANVASVREPIDKSQNALSEVSDLSTEVFVLEDYDGGGVAGIEIGPFGEGLSARVSENSDNSVLKLVDDATHFGLIHIKDFEVEHDISGYKRLEFWYSCEAADSERTLQVQLSFTNSLDPSIENFWNWRLPITLADDNNKWKKASIDLVESKFVRASERIEGNRFDLSRLNRVAVLILSNGASMASSPIYVDKITVSGRKTVNKKILPLASESTAGKLVLEDYDSGGVAGIEMGPFGEGVSARVSENSGNRVLKLVDDTTHFGLIHIKDFEVDQDISAYKNLEFWYSSDAADSERTLQVQLSFTNSLDPSIENFWNWRAPVTLADENNNWTKASIDLVESKFVRASERVEGNEFDLTRLNRIAVLILRNGTSKEASPVYVDNIAVSGETTEGGAALQVAMEPTFERRRSNNDSNWKTLPVAGSNAESLILEDYNGGGVDGVEIGPFGEGVSVLVDDKSGNRVRKLVDDATHFGLIHIKDFEVDQDVSGYKSLEFWYFCEAADSERTLQVQLSFTNPLDPRIENLWNWRMPVTLAAGSNNWTKASINLTESQFERASERLEGNEFDLTRLNRIAVLILSNGASEVASPVYVDNIAVSTEAAESENWADL